MRPTLLAPLKSLSFMRLLRTMTGSGVVSATRAQPAPGSMGTSNIEKKSAVVTRTTTLKGLMPVRPGSTTRQARYIMTDRCGMLERYRASASRKVTWSGGYSG